MRIAALRPNGGLCVPGFLLGLSTGAACLAYCGQVLVPYLLGVAEGWGRSYAALAQFLLGRLCGYLVFALAAWTFNLYVLREAGSASRAVISGATYLGLAAVLAVWSWRRPKAHCAGKPVCSGDSRRTLFPVLLGFLTGLNLCPPLLLAFTGAAETGSLWGSIFFFAAFFLGTSLYLIPLPLLGALGRREACRIVGRLAAAVVAFYYAYLGLITLLGGVLST